MQLFSEPNPNHCFLLMFYICFKRSIWIPYFIGADMIAGTRGAEVDTTGRTTTGRTTAVGTTGDTIGTNVSIQKCLSTLCSSLHVSTSNCIVGEPEPAEEPKLSCLREPEPKLRIAAPALAPFYLPQT
jgi:hypothetical protein